MDQTNQTQLDQQAVTLAKAIRQVESKGNFQAKGGSGEYGAYQFMPETWASSSQKYLGQNIPLETATPQQQNEVAYKKIKEMKDMGYNVGQIASIWNSGKPDAYLSTDSKGTNKYGMAYDVGAYAKNVATTYQTLKKTLPATTATPTPTVSAEPKSAGEAPTEGYSLGGFAGNVLKSGAGLLGGIANMALHPIQTVQNLGNAIQGGVELLIPGEQGHEEQAKAVGQFFADRYGGLDKIKNSFYNDPVGVALDLSTLLGGGAAIVKGASKVAGVAGAVETASQMGRTASVLSKAAEVTDPLSLAVKGAKGIIGVGGKVATEAAGISSGVGGEAIRSIYQAGKEGGDILKQTTDALRGRLIAEDVLQNAQKALQDLAEARRSEYLKAFNEQVKADAATGKNISQLPFDVVEIELAKQLEKFKAVVGEGGKLDFSGSAIGDRAAQGIAQKIYDDVISWKDKTPEGLDTLKRRLDSYYHETGDTRAMAQAMKASVRKVLTDNVKGYAKMTKGYEEASGGLKEAQMALGKPKDTQEQALRRVRSIFRDSQKERLSTVGMLESKTGRNIKGQVAGMISNPLQPGGLAKYMAEGAGIGGIIHPAALVGIIPGLIATSPRIVAEVARVLGITARKLEAMIAILEKTGLTKEQIMQMLVQAQRTTTPK